MAITGGRASSPASPLINPQEQLEEGLYDLYKRSLCCVPSECKRPQESLRALVSTKTFYTASNMYLHNICILHIHKNLQSFL